MTQTSHNELSKNLADAAKLVKLDAEYIHYKYPERRYKVMGLGVQEASEKVCVIYCDTRSPHIKFVRDLDSWLEQITVNHSRVARFTAAKSN